MRGSFTWAAPSRGRLLLTELSQKLGLPLFSAGDLRLYKRLTLVAESGRIVKVFYPVFPPDTHPAEVLTWAQHYFKVGE